MDCVSVDNKCMQNRKKEICNTLYGSNFLKIIVEVKLFTRRVILRDRQHFCKSKRRLPTVMPSLSAVELRFP